MSAPALELAAVKKSFGPIEIIRGLDLVVPAGERHAIIGPNGAGKSTMFNLVSGGFAPTSGSIKLDGREIGGLKPFAINRLGLSRSFQVTNIFSAMSVYENIRCATLRPSGLSLAFWRPLDGLTTVAAEAAATLDLIGLAHLRDKPAGALSYADQRALEIGVAVAGRARVILLDEPTAGMSREETARAVALIRKISAGRTLLIVEHDMGVVFGLADRISVLVYGKIIASGTPAGIRGNPLVAEAYLGTRKEAAA